MTDIQSILQALSAIRMPAQPEEYEIHAEIARVLGEAGIIFSHEYKLMPGRRIDFICGSIGIEVKKSRPVSAKLREQLRRYLDGTELTAMIVVLQKPCRLPETICGKPVYVLSLNRLWGVALP